MASCVFFLYVLYLSLSMAAACTLLSPAGLRYRNHTITYILERLCEVDPWAMVLEISMGKR